MVLHVLRTHNNFIVFWFNYSFFGTNQVQLEWLVCNCLSYILQKKNTSKETKLSNCIEKKWYLVTKSLRAKRYNWTESPVFWIWKPSIMTSIVEENGSSTIDNLAPPEAVGAPGQNNNNHSPHPHLPPPQALQQQGHSPVPSPAVLSASANIVQIIPSQHPQQTSSHQVS